MIQEIYIFIVPEQQHTSVAENMDFQQVLEIIILHLQLIGQWQNCANSYKGLNTYNTDQMILSFSKIHLNSLH